MNAQQRVAILGGLEPYTELTSGQLDKIARTASLIELAGGETLIFDGEQARHAYVLEQGRLQRYLLTPDGHRLVLNDTKAPASFGCAAACSDCGHLGMVRAVEPSIVLAIPSDTLLEQVQDNAGFALSLVHMLSQSSLRQTRLMYELMFPVPVRVARHLIRQADATGIVEIENKAALASQLNTVPETLSRALAVLRSRGLVKVSGQTVSVLDMKALKTYAGL